MIKQKYQDKMPKEAKSFIVKSTIGPDRHYSASAYLKFRRKIADAQRRYREQEEKEMANPRQRTLQLLYTAYNREIERFVFGDKKILVPGFDTIRITKEAYEKANLISERATKITSINEIYMHLLNLKSRRERNDGAIRDVYILREQQISDASCGRPSVKGEQESLRDIANQGKYVFAWGHSHGRMSTFHSGTDEMNLNNSTSAYGTKVNIIPKPFSCSSASFTFRFFPSLVFNSQRSKPSCHIGISYPHLEIRTDSSRFFYMNKTPKLEIIDEQNRIVLATESIDEEILERTNFKKRIEREKPVRLEEVGEKPEKKKEGMELDEAVAVQEYLQLLKDKFRINRSLEKYDERIKQLEVRCKKYESLLEQHENRISSLEQKLEESN